MHKSSSKPSMNVHGLKSDSKLDEFLQWMRRFKELFVLIAAIVTACLWASQYFATREQLDKASNGLKNELNEAGSKADKMVNESREKLEKDLRETQMKLENSLDKNCLYITALVFSKSEELLAKQITDENSVLISLRQRRYGMSHHNPEASIIIENINDLEVKIKKIKEEHERAKSIMNRAYSYASNDASGIGGPYIRRCGEVDIPTSR